MRKNRNMRRGVLMLIVLIILTLFVLLVLTYLLLGNQAARLSANSANNNSTSNTTVAVTENVNYGAKQVIRGYALPTSSLSIHSLLEDMWGNGDTRAFSGTGTNSDNDPDGIPYALQPHSRGWLTGASFDQLDAGYAAAIAAGKMDEDYDAADYRNMVLALVDENGVVIPSLHRPSLVRYMQAQYTSFWNDTSDPLKRRVMFRPLIEDHPDFNGSNPAFDPVNGPWDVDNDGDGQRDSVWVDLGAVVRASPDGRLFKPLYAIMCVDLDGRLNVNVHSNPQCVAGGGTGSGYGPAEISLHSVALDHTALLSARYGADGVPGAAADPVAIMKQWSLPWAAWNPATLTSCGSPLDMYGRGTVTLTGYGYPLYTNMLSPVGNPYRTNVANGVGDELFTLAEMEAVLRPNDIDTGTLPARLRGLLKSGVRNVITARSHTSSFYSGPVDVSTATTSPRLISGIREDLNARFGDGLDNNGNGVVDEPGEATSEVAWWKSSDTLPSGVPAAYQNVALDISDASGTNRQAMAKRLFDIAVAVLPSTSAETKQQIAQWCVNVVDFRDRDSIMTRFEYQSGESVWGCERPELLISEVVAWHDRRTQDTAAGGGVIDRADSDVDQTFDQVRRPQGNLFVELYNPTGLDSPLPAELYGSGTELALNKTTPQGYPVWRLAVVEGCSASGPIASTYFIPSNASITISDSGRAFWTSNIVPTIPRGGYATIGPASTTFAGQRSGTDNTYTKTITLGSLPGVSLSIDPVFLNDSGNVVASGSATRKLRFSVSEPLDGYPVVASAPNDDDFYAAADVADQPYDYTNDASDDNLGQDNTIDSYSIVNLQRIANPLLAWHATDNPYITVDSMNVDLTVYTGEPLLTATNEFASGGNGSIKFDSRERSGANNNIWAQVSSGPTGGTLGVPLPNATLGQLNSTFSAPTGANIFPWLTWNNRPYVSNLELLLVPRVGPHDLLDRHGIAAGSGYTSADGRFGHLFNPLFAGGGSSGDSSSTVTQPILEYRFNETGNAAPSTGSDETPVKMFDITTAEADRHTPDCRGVSGRPGDRAFDNTQAASHGVFTPGGIAKHDADNNSIDGLKSFTLAGWIMPNTVITNNAAIFANQDSVAEPDKGFTLSATLAGSLQLQVNPTGGTGVATSAASYTDTDWFFFAVTYDGVATTGNVRFYKGTKGSGVALVGTAQTINKGTIVDEDHIFTIGNYTAPASNAGFPNNGPLDALLDNMRVFGSKTDASGVLTLAELETFRQADLLSTSGATPAELQQRVLEYFCAPSQFAGTDKYPSPTGAVHPSYGGMPSLWEPGRVNINTLSQTTWNAILNGSPGPTFDSIVATRRGYVTAGDNRYPTAFARPFRSFAGGSADPDASGYPVPDITAAGGSLAASEIDFTLLRPHPTDTARPLLSYVSTANGDNTNRNPYFYYRPATRMGNLLAVQSNVYAVWITVGHFEVEATTPSAVYPDGYKLKKELGWETGNITRHRGFYIFDRTLSDFRQQAFARGSDVGVDECIVLKRPIE